MLVLDGGVMVTSLGTAERAVVMLLLPGQLLLPAEVVTVTVLPPCQPLLLVQLSTTWEPFTTTGSTYRWFTQGQCGSTSNF